MSDVFLKGSKEEMNTSPIVLQENEDFARGKHFNPTLPFIFIGDFFKWRI
jgi:hypothetical protein